MTDVELAIALAETGAEIVRMQFGTQLQRIEKSAGDFATNADVDAEMAMTALLRRERPHDGVIGEEGGQSGSRGASRAWFIDPLCGTLNYAVQMRVVAVNVALKEGAAFTAAAVADPFNNENAPPADGDDAKILTVKRPPLALLAPLQSVNLPFCESANARVFFCSAARSALSRSSSTSE